MLRGLLDLTSMCVAVGSVALLAYGGFLVCVFHCNATKSAQRVVARLALHESLVQSDLLIEVKAEALTH